MLDNITLQNLEYLFFIKTTETKGVIFMAAQFFTISGSKVTCIRINVFMCDFCDFG